MTTPIKGVTIVWQSDTYEGVNEMPIVLCRYQGSIELQQEGRTILIAEDHIEEVIKAMRKVAKETF